MNIFHKQGYITSIISGLYKGHAGHRKALPGKGRNGEEEKGAGAGPGAVHVPTGRRGRGGGALDAGWGWADEWRLPIPWGGLINDLARSIYGQTNKIKIYIQSA